MSKNEPIDRLGDEIRGPNLVRPSDGIKVVETSDEEDRNSFAAGQLADRRADFEAIHVWHHNVKQNQVWFAANKGCERRFPVLCFFHGKAVLFQHFTRQPAHHWRVIDD